MRVSVPGTAELASIVQAITHDAVPGTAAFGRIPNTQVGLMVDTKLEQETVYRKVRHAVRLTQEHKYDEALLLFEMYMPLLSSHNEDEKRLLTLASSYCGLCMAEVKHHYADALEYCNISVQRDVTNPDHHANTALVYLEWKDRKRAVRHLQAGLKLQPTNPRIHKILDEIGWRRRPVIRFLKRSNPINRVLGMIRGREPTRRHHS
jgi:tetratricopeptide (TPR) repeat protein